MINFKIAIRNLTRYKYRSLLTGLMISVTTFIFIFGLSLAEGVSQGLIERVKVLNTGDVIITADENTESSDASFDDVKWDKQKIMNIREINSALLDYQEITEVQNRVKVTGILAANNKSGTCVIVGIEAGKELEMLDSDLAVHEGAFLSPEANAGEIYISSTIAETYNLEVGDQLELACQTVDMGNETKQFEVCGVFGATSWKEYYVYIGLNDAQALTGLGSDGATHLKVLLAAGENAKFMAEKINEDISDFYHIFANDWRTSGGLLLATVMVIESSVYGMCAILFLLIIVILINNISMSIYERTNEIGILKAMGKEDKSIIGMFLIENLVLSLFFSALGEIVGATLALILNRSGIPAFVEVLRLSFGADYTYPVLRIAFVILTFLLPVAVTVAVSVVPMRKVLQLSPAVAAAYEK